LRETQQVALPGDVTGSDNSFQTESEVAA
jgi:hypothetical protein